MFSNIPYYVIDNATHFNMYYMILKKLQFTICRKLLKQNSLIMRWSKGCEKNSNSKFLIMQQSCDKAKVCQTSSTRIS